MPVKVKKISGKYRIVDSNGNIEKTDSGAARDGGGHDSPEKAGAQAAHINKSYRKKKKRKNRGKNRGSR